MKMFSKFIIYTTIALSIAGCGTSTMKPNYLSADMDLMRIGGDKPKGYGAGDHQYGILLPPSR
jgi:hypothetical protein